MRSRCPSVLFCERTVSHSTPHSWKEVEPVDKNIELTILVYPTAGESFIVTTTEFAAKADALNHLSEALVSGTLLRLVDRSKSEGESAIVFNLANVVAIRVLTADGGTGTGQYL